LEYRIKRTLPYKKAQDTLKKGDYPKLSVYNNNNKLRRHDPIQTRPKRALQRQLPRVWLTKTNETGDALYKRTRHRAKVPFGELPKLLAYLSEFTGICLRAYPYAILANHCDEKLNTIPNLIISNKKLLWL